MAATATKSVLNERYERHKKKASLLQRAISAAGREIGAIPAVLDPERKDNGRRNLRVWIEEYCAKAVHLGWSRTDAKEMVIQSVRGSAMFAERSSVHPAEMRNLVTSPGGTTADAIYQLDKGGFRTVLSKAVMAAHERSVALGELDEARSKAPPARARRSGRTVKRKAAAKRR